jgi:hypothetical protein
MINMDGIAHGTDVHDRFHESTTIKDGGHRSEPDIPGRGVETSITQAKKGESCESPHKRHHIQIYLNCPGESRAWMLMNSGRSESVH